MTAPAPPQLPGPIEALLIEAAHARSLLVAVDFDGTLAPIVPDPTAARPHPRAVAALRALSALPNTHAAIVSGRALADLAHICGPTPGVTLIGSHGAEHQSGAPILLDAAQSVLLAGLAEDLDVLALQTPGARVERKPGGVAFHYRTAEAWAADAAVRAILAGPAQRPGVYIRPGSMVLELAVTPAHKGEAVAGLRRASGADRIIFIGDDLTDEDAFAALDHADLAIKVGPGDSRAAARVANSDQVAWALDTLAERRSVWSVMASPPPIERMSMLSDQRTVAMVTDRASIVWLCLPRIDSPALFAALLGGPGAGAFSIAPANGRAPGIPEYDGDSFVLRTRWPGVVVTDYFDCSAGRPFQRAGRTDLVRVIEGSGVVEIVFAPRLDFGRAQTRLSLREGGIEVDGPPDPVVLHAPGIAWRIEDQGPHHTARALADLSAGPLTLEMRFGTAGLRPSPVPEPQRREQTRRFWVNWAATLRLPRVAPDLVRRSALVLKALCHAPTGAIAAAGTTSLPETPGGVRNWDYRFCWPRDACYAAGSLVRLGNTGQALKLLDWLIGVVEDAESPARLRPVYTVTGAELGSEGEISELVGYAGSRPVRVGNAAAQQVQLDVFGPIVELVAMLAEQNAPITPDYWRLAEKMAEAVAARWREPDHGIWEIRTAKRHHVHSRVMCWLTIDRALALSEHHTGRPRKEWETLRAAILEDVLEHGFDPAVGAFTTAYGFPDFDAAALAVGLTGMLPPDDPRFVATVDAVSRTLREGPTVYRYRCDDGLPGREGGFHICAAWLVRALVLVGRAAEARELFEQMTALAGPTGLLPEQYDPALRLSLGNHPQAYSHIGVIDAALALHGAL